MMTIQKYLGVPADWRVRENIGYEIILLPTKQDIARARKGDPMGCALHNAACRTFQVPNAAIGGRWAYIPQRDEKGRPYIARMQATEPTQRAIEVFDKTGEMPEGGFRFRPIAPSHQAKRKNAWMALYRQGLVGHSMPKRKQRAKALEPMRILPRLTHKGRVRQSAASQARGGATWKATKSASIRFDYITP